MVEPFYKPQKEEITTQPKGVLRESDTRMIIDRKLRKWFKMVSTLFLTLYF